MSNTNFLLATDSYKMSHYAQYPEGTENVYSYIEARRNCTPYNTLNYTKFFGLQMFIQEYLMRPVTAEDVAEAEELCIAHSGYFPKVAFQKLVTEYAGYFPVEIKALPEGIRVPFGVPLVTVEYVGKDEDAKDMAWMSSWLETALLRAVWYPTTVATISSHCKDIIRSFLEKTSDDPLTWLPTRLHDFGARGASSYETSGIGGLAHLANFIGTDTLAAIVFGRKFYNARMAGGSIPAAEHSTITSWLRENEVEAYRNMVKQFGKPGSVFAVVSDSYDIHKAATEHWGTTLKQEVIDCGGLLVVRPDSGDPVTTPVQVVKELAAKFGVTINGKGFKVLKNVRVIQGDGVNPNTIYSILYALELAGYSAENIAFGMGGALLQAVTRDDFSFAMKCSAAKVNGVWRDVYKDPVGGGKTSKKGRFKVIEENGVLKSASIESAGTDVLRTVYCTGAHYNVEDLDTIRARDC